MTDSVPKRQHIRRIAHIFWHLICEVVLEKMVLVSNWHENHGFD